MKLESLESKKISNLNLIVGGVNSITDGTNTGLGNWPTMHGSSCSTVIENGSYTITCDSINLDT